MDGVAFVDGKPVPCVMTLSQVQALFPQGLVGLCECFGGRSHVFPDAEGTFHLKGGASYTLKLSGAAKWPSQGEGKGEKQGPCAWAPSLSTSTSTAAKPIVDSTALYNANAEDEQCLFRSANASPCYAEKSVRDIFHSASPPDALSDARAGKVSYNVGTASSLAEDDAPRTAVDCSGELSFCLPLVGTNDTPGKHIQDRVHEYVFLPTIAIRIVDTLEFQRLRSLKQLGTTVFLYPGATHTRFEHSIGVAHLASQMVRQIALCQPELNITRADTICVTVAGLCHDIGHGPFSHLFEHLVNRIREKKRIKDTWHHEQMSIRLLRRILSRINLWEYGLTDEDARFIELCILGLAPKSPWPTNVGRPPYKRFLVDIVANKRNGVDVDRLDYFLRDSLGCYGRAALDVHIPRLFSACKVLCYEGEYQICFEEKMALSLSDILNVRAKLHKHAYQHRLVKVTDYMVSDALYEADPFFKVRGKNGKLISMSECVEDEEGFCQLGDWVCNAIAASSDPRLAKAQSIIQRINERNLYRVVGTAMFARFQVRVTEESIREEILSYCMEIEADLVLRDAIDKTLIVSFVVITFGSFDDNGLPDDPINKVTFYNPKNIELGAFKLPRTRVSPLFLPSEYGERMLFVMVREEALADVVTAAFEAWRERYERHLGVAVPTSNRRKDESPGKGSARPRRFSENRDVLSGNDFVSFEEMQRQVQTAACEQEAHQPQPQSQQQQQQHFQRGVKSARSPSCKLGNLQGERTDGNDENNERVKRICTSVGRGNVEEKHTDTCTHEGGAVE
ncbi:hypothetical protein TcCL_NonESM00603 [Trypanosoma cruzi]|nr:hypothetical protein TcCL_NonESM00603 [Trypanosoma cruzi]